MPGPSIASIRRTYDFMSVEIRTPLVRIAVRSTGSRAGRRQESSAAGDAASLSLSNQ